jgi:hypothetical protein
MRPVRRRQSPVSSVYLLRFGVVQDIGDDCVYDEVSPQIGIGLAGLPAFNKNLKFWTNEYTRMCGDRVSLSDFANSAPSSS